MTGVLIYDKKRSMPFLWLPLYLTGTANGGSLTAIVSRALVSIS